jgi:hypothetical protein
MQTVSPKIWQEVSPSAGRVGLMLSGYEPGVSSPGEGIDVLTEMSNLLVSDLQYSHTLATNCPDWSLEVIDTYNLAAKYAQPVYDIKQGGHYGTYSVFSFKVGDRTMTEEY